VIGQREHGNESFLGEQVTRKAKRPGLRLQVLEDEADRPRQGPVAG
jgi:hypothetical protein